MPPKRGNRLPNIVLFGIDSLRADHMSCYGYNRLTTPQIDAFASQGTLSVVIEVRERSSFLSPLRRVSWLTPRSAN